MHANNAHPFMPGMHGNDCAREDCGQTWNAFVHQPDQWLTGLPTADGDEPSSVKLGTFANPDKYVDASGALKPHTFKGGLYDDCSICGQPQPYRLHRPPGLNEPAQPRPETKIGLHFKPPTNGDFLGMIRKSVGKNPSVLPTSLAGAVADMIANEAEANEFFGSLSDDPHDFHSWWVEMADREAPTIQRKAEEYGTNSLVEMGRIWSRAQSREVNDLEAIEIGCFLYAYGKIQRVADALLKGKSPNVDSWHDLTIYSLMVQYSREKGTWP